MKIDPSQKPLPITPPNTVHSHGALEGKSAFAKVLGESMQQQGVAPKEKTGLTPSVTAPVIMPREPTRSTAWRTADGLLDALDAYRDRLMDPKSTLKMIEPNVARMKAQVEKAQPVLDQLPEGDPVQNVLQQTMVHVSKEIERFNMGYYVDE